ncbi:Cytochrome p450 [Thalictrum thalictroides]|uniref:Cytochrome p450 n=1 Tax=Thalictrum thalictroides TaxID=46969 RepID=A0A7J6WPL2_THATH|nr:Cytochrome p450 [Thalictrum thalictroides]
MHSSPSFDNNGILDVGLTLYDFFNYLDFNLQNMILGGVDTTTVTLTWALSLLLNNRNILQMAQNEIDSIVGKDRLVDESDITKLVYLQAVVKETMRLYPAAPLSAQHVAIEDCTVSGYHVSAGTWLFTNIYKIQRDPRVWSRPSEFQPERFLTTQANVDLRGNHFEFIPFGSGRRSCPGVSLALHVVHLTLARLLQSFDFETPSNAAVDMTESAGLTNLKATPLEVLITPRLASSLY